jgi:hypothetical protein
MPSVPGQGSLALHCHADRQPVLDELAAMRQGLMNGNSSSSTLAVDTGLFDTASLNFLADMPSVPGQGSLALHCHADRQPVLDARTASFAADACHLRSDAMSGLDRISTPIRNWDDIDIHKCLLPPQLLGQKAGTLPCPTRRSVFCTRCHCRQNRSATHLLAGATLDGHQQPGNSDHAYLCRARGCACLLCMLCAVAVDKS